jgi:lipoprotein NlpD
VRAWLPALGFVLVVAHAGARPAEAETAAVRAARVHEVKRGDTVSGIARAYGVSVRALVAANGLAGTRSRLRPGQRLAIPAAAATPAPSPARRPTPPPRRRAARAVPVGVKPPDNLVLAVPAFAAESPSLAWPVDGAVSSNFGRRRRGWHRGIDILADPGAPITAAAPGVVVASGFEREYGNVVKVAHDGGFVTVYAHNEQNLVELGEWVQAGQMIATVGRTGRATREHLHFEVRHEGLAYNPLYLLPSPPRIAQVDDVQPADADDE